MQVVSHAILLWRMSNIYLKQLTCPTQALLAPHNFNQTCSGIACAEIRKGPFGLEACSPCALGNELSQESHLGPRGFLS
eukprot:1148202-Pelagomonas_calceolata.AAC.2